MGYYGSAPGALLTEVSPRGETFLADLCGEWESAALGAGDHARVALLRTAPIVHPQGVLKPLLLLTRFGVSGPIGRGTQKWPWISLEDEVRGIRHVIDSQIAGPVNLTGPTPASANDLGFALAVRMNRPFVLRAPVWALRLVLGADATEALLTTDAAVRAERARGVGLHVPPPDGRAGGGCRGARSGRLGPPLGGLELDRAPHRRTCPLAVAGGVVRQAEPVPGPPVVGVRLDVGAVGGKTASPSSRTTRPLGRTVTGSSGRPPSASSRRASCSARTPNHSSRPSAHAAMTGSTTRASAHRDRDRLAADQQQPGALRDQHDVEGEQHRHQGDADACGHAPVARATCPGTPPSATARSGAGRGTRMPMSRKLSRPTITPRASRAAASATRMPGA